MIDHVIQKWNGYDFYSNLPERDFYGFRETGYAADLVKQLNRTYPEVCKNYDVLLYFQLAHDPPVWKIYDFTKPLLLFIAGHEAPGLPSEVINKAAFIFKQYLDPQLTQRYSHVFRIPVGPSSQFPETDIKDFSKREYSVFFAGNLHAGRKKLYQQLAGLTLIPFPLLYRMRKYLKKDFNNKVPASVITFSSHFHSGFSSDSYANKIADSKIVLCPYGVDDKETMRHFEAAKQGCVIVSDRMPDTWYFKEAPFVIVENWENIYDELSALIKNETLLERKHCEALLWWNNCCSINAVLAFIYNRINLSLATH